MMALPWLFVWLLIFKNTFFFISAKVRGGDSANAEKSRREKIPSTINGMRNIIVHFAIIISLNKWWKMLNACASFHNYTDKNNKSKTNIYRFELIQFMVQVFRNNSKIPYFWFRFAFCMHRADGVKLKLARKVSPISNPTAFYLPLFAHVDAAFCICIDVKF